MQHLKITVKIKYKGWQQGCQYAQKTKRSASRTNTTIKGVKNVEYAIKRSI